MDYLLYFDRSPEICGGQWVIHGTRVSVRTILASLAEGPSNEEILEDFPYIANDDIQAVVAFAAASVEEDLPLVGVPSL